MRGLQGLKYGLYMYADEVFFRWWIVTPSPLLCGGWTFSFFALTTLLLSADVVVYYVYVAQYTRGLFLFLNSLNWAWPLTVFFLFSDLKALFFHNTDIFVCHVDI